MLAGAQRDNRRKRRHTDQLATVPELHTSGLQQLSFFILLCCVTGGGFDISRGGYAQRVSVLQNQGNVAGSSSWHKGSCALSRFLSKTSSSICCSFRYRLEVGKFLLRGKFVVSFPRSSLLCFRSPSFGNKHHFAKTYLDCRSSTTLTKLVGLKTWPCETENQPLLQRSYCSNPTTFP